MMSRVHGIAERPRIRTGDSGVNRPGSGNAFQNCLRDACASQNLKLSGHAEQRIVQRGLRIDASDLEKVSRAIERVAEKGGAKSAIFMKDLVFIADARERAIITAMSSNNEDNHVFTGIDSAVFA
jgi:flagellar operon protein